MIGQQHDQHTLDMYAAEMDVKKEYVREEER